MKNTSFQSFVAVAVIFLGVQSGWMADPPAGQGPGPQLRHPPISTNALYVLSPDGQHFASAGKDGRVKYGRTSDGAVLRTVFHCTPTALAFSPDGTLLATAGLACKSTVRVWRVVDSKRLHELPNERAAAQSLVFSPDSQFLACRNGDSEIKLWQLPNQELKWSFSFPPAELNCR